MKLWKRATGALCLMGLVIAYGCAKPAPPPEETTEPAPATEAIAPPEAAAPEAKEFPALGIKFAVPADWKEVEAKDVQEGQAALAFGKSDDSPSPRVQITLTPADKVKQAKDAGMDPIGTTLEMVKSGLAEGKDKAEVVSEGDWTATGITSGKKLRIKGTIPEGQLLSGEAVVEVMVGETADGAVYTVMAGAADEAGLDEAVKALSTIEFAAVPVSAPTAGAASTEPGATPSETEKPAEPAPKPGG